MLLATVGTALLLAVVAVGPHLTDVLPGGDAGAKVADDGPSASSVDEAATAPGAAPAAAGAAGGSQADTESPVGPAARSPGRAAARQTEAPPPVLGPPATGGAVARPGAVSEPSIVQEEDATATATLGGWVCNGSVELQDPRGRDWQIRQIGFLVQPRYERVVLHLQRTGPGRAAPSSLTAQSFATTAIRDFAPVAVPPRSGATTLGVHLADGFGSGVSLRHYRPQGTRLVRELSVYPAGRMSSAKVLISTTSRGCFRLRVPAWEDPVDPDAQATQVQIDIR